MEILQQVGAVAGVLLLLIAALWWLRRRGFAAGAGRPGAARRLECLERMALGPQQTLHLLRLGEQALLVASWPSGCSLLRSLAWSEIDRAREVRP